MEVSEKEEAEASQKSGKRKRTSESERKID